jgi:hypothetical protein
MMVRSLEIDRWKSSHVGNVKKLFLGSGARAKFTGRAWPGISVADRNGSLLG